MSSRKRKRNEREDDDDDDFDENAMDMEEDDEDDEDRQPELKKRKKSQSQQQPASEMNMEDEEDEEQEEPEWVNGKIVRIALNNFMTYDNVTMKPGPGLNLILGANGTGKSSIVCGFCLGLGGKSSLLGRASKVKDYVKHGCTEGWVEIELFRENRDNLVIRRVLKRGGTTNWRINGKRESQEKVMKKMKKLNIEFENLTQFLPQDKVGEFANLTPEKLLDWTQRSILTPEELEFYQKLLERQGSTGDDVREIESLERNLEVEKTKNFHLQKQVTQYMKKKAHLEKIKQLVLKKHVVKFTDTKIEVKNFKAEHNAAKLKYNEYLKNENPLRDEINELKAKRTAVKKRAELVKKTLGKQRSNLNKICDQLANVAEKNYALENDMSNLFNRVDRKQRKEEDLKTKILGMERTIQNIGDPDDIKARGKVAQKLYLTEKKEYDKKTKAINSLEDKVYEYRQKMDDIKRNLARVSNIKALKERKIKRYNGDAYNCFGWVQAQANRNTFEEKVYFVPMEINVKREYKDFAGILEWQCQKVYWKSFVVLAHADRQKILKSYADVKRKNISVIYTEEQDYRVDYDLEQLKREYNVITDLDSMFEANPLIKSLFQGAGIKNVVICRNGKKIDKLLEETTIKAAFDIETGRRYRITKSEYGERRTTVQQTKYRGRHFQKEGRVLVSIDEGKIRELEAQKEKAAEDCKEVDIEIDALKTEQGNLLTKKNAAQKERKSLETKWRSLKRSIQKLKSYKKDLNELEEEDILEEEKKILMQIHKNNATRLKLALKIKAHVKKYVVDNEKYQVVQLNTLRDNKKLQQLLAKQTQERSELVRLKEVYSNLKTRYDNAKKELETLKNIALSERDKYIKDVNVGRLKRGEEPMTPVSLKALLIEYPEDVETLERSIEQERDAADKLIGDERTLHEFEKRRNEIENMIERLKRMKGEFDRVRSEIRALERKWSVPFKEKIVRINKKFQGFCRKLGINGEIRLKVNEKDYKNSRIDLLVKFRDKEKLTTLSANRQSGGEKSVTTILYILAMQSEGKSPFFIVDEINQGMDPTNERNVFLEMVKHSNKKGVPQSFLITPKLLPNLIPIDEPHLNVFFIFNGVFNLGMKKTKQWMKDWTKK